VRNINNQYSYINLFIMSIPTYDTLKKEYMDELIFNNRMDELNSSRLVTDYIDLMAQTVKMNRDTIVTNRYNFTIPIRVQDLKVLKDPAYLCRDITTFFKQYNYNFASRYNYERHTCEFNWVWDRDHY